MYHRRVTTYGLAMIRWGVTAAVVAVASLAGGCSSEAPRPITVTAQTITVDNQSRDSWENVEIWLNDLYRVTRSRMLPGERFGVPLNAFVAGFGQRFVPGRQVVKGIEVTATTARGEAVRLVWGEGRRR
jgi:hypothetical protein